MTQRMWMTRILNQESERIARIRENWLFYSGDHTPQLGVRPGKPNDNVIINISELIVNTGVDFLFGKEINWELAEGETTTEEEWLEDLWRLNQKMTLLTNASMMGGVTGHVFIKIMPKALRLGDALFPRLVVLDSAIVHKIPEPDDVETIRRYIIEFTSIDPDSGDEITKKQVIERVDVPRPEGASPNLPIEPKEWELTWLEAKGGGKFVVVAQEAWPFPWPPIIDTQNLPNPGEPYGLSDLEDAELNLTINGVASKINRILRYHSSPQVWGEGFNAKTVDFSTDTIKMLPAGGSLQNLEMQTELIPSRAFLSDMIELYHHVSRTPRLDPAKVNVGALSGFALRVLNGPILGKTTLKQRLYGDMLIELNRRLLDLNGMGEDNYVTLYWDDPLPVDKTEQADELETEIGMGTVSLETASTELGRDWEVEKVRIAADQTDAMTMGERMALAFDQGLGGEGGRIPPEEEEELLTEV